MLEWLFKSTALWIAGLIGLAILGAAVNKWNRWNRPKKKRRRKR